MENEEKITLSKEELNALLEEAAKRGAREALDRREEPEAPAAAEVDPEDAEALEFISTFGSENGGNSLGMIFGRALAGGRDKLEKARAKLEAYNEFEAKIAPYYDYADDPEEAGSDLAGAELARYTRKHEIYMRLRAEKLRRFGLLGFQRGGLNSSVLDELERALARVII